MTIRKTKSGKWTVDVSNGFHPVTQKRIRIIRKGLKSKKEALELEQHIRVVELKEKQFDFVVTTDMLFDLLEEDDLKNGRKVSYTSTQRNNYERHIKPYFKNNSEIFSNSSSLVRLNSLSVMIKLNLHMKTF